MEFVDVEFDELEEPNEIDYDEVARECLRQSGPANKVAAIKFFREATGFGLKEAKAYIDKVA